MDHLWNPGNRQNKLNGPLKNAAGDLHRTGTHPGMHGEIAMRVNSILIVKMSAVGDVVMSIPALNALRAAYPHARIDWLVEPAAADILRDLPGLDRIIVFPRPELARLVKACKPVPALRLWDAFKIDLQVTRYDVALDLQGLLG